MKSSQADFWTWKSPFTFWYTYLWPLYFSDWNSLQVICFKINDLSSCLQDFKLKICSHDIPFHQMLLIYVTLSRIKKRPKHKKCCLQRWWDKTFFDQWLVGERTSAFIWIVCIKLHCQWRCILVQPKRKSTAKNLFKYHSMVLPSTSHAVYQLFISNYGLSYFRSHNIHIIVLHLFANVTLTLKICWNMLNTKTTSTLQPSKRPWTITC